MKKEKEKNQSETRNKRESYEYQARHGGWKYRLYMSNHPSQFGEKGRILMVLRYQQMARYPRASNVQPCSEAPLTKTSTLAVKTWTTCSLRAANFGKLSASVIWSATSPPRCRTYTGCCQLQRQLQQMFQIKLLCCVKDGMRQIARIAQ